MKHHNHPHEHDPAIKAVRRERRKKPTMKVSGASVKKLQKLILRRAEVDKRR